MRTNDFNRRFFEEQINLICNMGFEPYIIVQVQVEGYSGHMGDGMTTTLSVAPHKIRNYMVSDEGVYFEMTCGGELVCNTIPWAAIGVVHAAGNPEVGFVWMLPIEEVYTKETPVVEAVVSGNGLVNDGAPVGKAGWKPTIVK